MKVNIALNERDAVQMFDFLRSLLEVRNTKKDSEVTTQAWDALIDLADKLGEDLTPAQAKAVLARAPFTRKGPASKKGVAS